MDRKSNDESSSFSRKQFHNIRGIMVELFEFNIDDSVLNQYEITFKEIVIESCFRIDPQSSYIAQRGPTIGI